MLQGKKTYIAGTILFLLGGLFGLGVIDKDTFEALAAMIGGALGMSLRLAIKNEFR